MGEKICDCALEYDSEFDCYDLVRADGFRQRLDRRFNRRFDYFCGHARPAGKLNRALFGPYENNK